MSRPIRPSQILPKTLQRVTRAARSNGAVKTITICDDDGNVRTQLGYQDDGAWGLRVWDNNGDLQVDDTA